jgi:hypothetical protein
MSFHDSLKEYQDLLCRKAVLDEMTKHLKKFVPSDIRTECMKIRTNEGSLTLEVSPTLIESFIAEFEKRNTEIVEQIEKIN